MDGCAFCDIVRGVAPARVVYESDGAVAFLPDVPAVRGHTLVVPRQHVPDFLAAGAGVQADVSSACSAVGKALEAALSPEGMNAITSKGGAATQTVFHLHVHLLPRWAGDRLGDFWPPDQQTPAAELDKLADLVRQSFFAG